MPDGQGAPPDDTAPKQPGNRWPKGTSGNPLGRPAGVRNRVLEALDKVGGEAAAGVLQAAVTAALAGDVRAQELILSRIWPARRDRPVSLALPPIASASDVMAAMGAVTSAIAAGTITPGEGAAVAGVLEAGRRVIETADLAERVAALEAANGQHEGEQ